jgi:hypothetical protein
LVIITECSTSLLPRFGSVWGLPMLKLPGAINIRARFAVLISAPVLSALLPALDILLAGILLDAALLDILLAPELLPILPGLGSELPPQAANIPQRIQSAAITKLH